MPFELFKNFHGIGIGPHSKILAVMIYQFHKFLINFYNLDPLWQAPHISLVYNSEYENYLYCYNPIAQLSATAFMVFMYNDMIDNEIVIQNASGLSVSTVCTPL